MKPVKFHELEQRISYTFQNKELLRLAMTHSSYANKQKKQKKLLKILVNSIFFRNFAPSNK